MSIVMDLSSRQLRVLGCLIEKETTTPDQYPLSLNALNSACNQKSNREPIMSLSEAEVQAAVDELAKLHLVTSESGFGSRVAKYKHRFCNTEFGKLKLSTQELGVLCVLFLRGPQTPGELRTRTNRLCEFADVGEVEVVLRELAHSDDGPFVQQLSRESGKRESRYVHLFGEQVDATDSIRDPDLNQDSAIDRADISNHIDTSLVAKSNQGQAQQLEALEHRVTQLSDELAELKQMMNELLE